MAAILFCRSQPKPMRGLDLKQNELFSYTTLEQRIPNDHPLRPLRGLVDTVLASMDRDFDGLYSTLGRASIAPERLLRASLLQVIYTIRSERQLVEQIDFNLLFRWFVGLSMDERMWDHSTFSQNRDRLFNQDVARLFFQRIKSLAAWSEYASNEHFSVDGTLIDAWASHKSFIKKDGGDPPEDGTRNPDADFKGEKRSNATHQSTSDPEARLARKSNGDASRLALPSDGRRQMTDETGRTDSSGHSQSPTGPRLPWNPGSRLPDVPDRRYPAPDQSLLPADRSG